MNAAFFITGVKKISLFQIVFFFTLLICFLPLLPGLAGLFLAAFGFMPMINQYHFSLTGFYQLANWPGIMDSLLITLLITISSTLLTAVLAFSILQSCWTSRWWRKLESLLAPILALPHVAFAVGFAFLFTPSGFMARFLTFFSSDTSLVNWHLINNQYGLGQIFALTIKEIPFILFMSIPLLKQLNLKNTLQTAQSLGYSQAQAWQKIIFPQWLPKIRFSLFAIMAYSLSVVDVSLVIGPNKPPTLPVLVWGWLNDADLLTLPRASAGAFLLLLICVFLIYLIRLNEWLIVNKFQNWQINGRFSLPVAGQSAVLFIYSISVATVFILLIWSFTQRWAYPNILPSEWSLRFWLQEWDYLWDIIMTSVYLALGSATLALLLVFILHEHNAKTTHSYFAVPHLLIAVPIIAPQLSILFGIQVATLYIAEQQYCLWVLWSHLFFVFPYVYLALDGPWRSYDNRLDRVASSLAMPPFKVWWKIKMPILLPAIWIAWAIGISVSLAQYLPTLMLGAGRISTLTTEAVALASGQDRRISAIYALLQSLIPFFFYIIALFVGRKTGRLDNQARSVAADDLIAKKYKYN